MIGPMVGYEDEHEAPTRGDVLGRYELLEIIGTGGMGVVHRARDPSLAREVALKLVRTDLVAEPAMSRARLLREAQAMARVSHPNVVPIYDVGVAGRHVFIAMELVHGRNLPQWLREQPRSVAAIVDAFIDVGRGLEAVHAAGLVHRDLKPTNVLVDGERARLMDFGLARAFGGSRDTEPGEPGSVRPVELPSSLSSQLTEAGSVLGTPAYMAPEQMLVDGEVDARSDQYAYCVALFQALHGRLPFEAATMEELWRKKHAVQIAEVRPPEGLARRVDAIARRGLASDPAARWPSMTALLAALEHARAPRRRGPAIAGALLGAAGLAAVVGWLAVDREDACQAEDPLAGTWDDARRGALRSAWEASGVPYHEAAWAKVEHHLDAYADALRPPLRAACEAERAAEGSPAPDPRVACLHDRRRRLAAVGDALALADASVMEAGLSWVIALPPVRACDDDRYVGPTLAAPSSPAAEREVAALRERLAQAAAQAKAGRDEPARAEIEAVITSADALGDGPLRAEARVQLGRLHADRKRRDEAVDALSRGYFIAVEHGADALALDAAIELAGQTTFQSRHDEAEQWLRTAEALLRAVGEEPSLRDRVLRQRGQLENALGHPAESVASYEQALALERELYGDGHPRVADTLLDLGQALRRQEGSEAQAREVLERALAAADEAYDPTHPSVADFHNGLANVLVQLGELDEALRHYTRAEAITRAAYGEGTPKVAGYLVNRAHVHIARDELEQARSLTTEALGLFEASHGSESPEVALALNNLGLIHRGLRDDVAAARYFRRALDVMLARWGPTHPQVTSLRRNLGEALLGQGRLDDAKQALGEVLAQAGQGRVSPDDVAVARFGIARIAWERNEDRPAAHALAEQAHAELAALGDAFASDAQVVRAWLDEHPRPR